MDKERYEHLKDEIRLTFLLQEVTNEIYRQIDIFGKQNHSPAEWLMILGEEVGEANRGALEAHFKGFGYEKEGDYSDYRRELVHVAAVAISAMRSYDEERENAIKSTN